MDLELVQAGLEWVQTKTGWMKESRTNWMSDFGGSFYKELYRLRGSELDSTWWDATVTTLIRWQAYRSSKPGYTKDNLRARGSERLGSLNEHFQKIRRLAGPDEPTLENTDWEDLAGLFREMSAIKPGTSPMFASKLGHFIFPRAFIVLDNLATGLFPYEIAWRGLRCAWRQFDAKPAAREMLSKAIADEETMPSDYPFETKIAELWLIGYNYRGSLHLAPPGESD